MNQARRPLSAYFALLLSAALTGCEPEPPQDTFRTQPAIPVETTTLTPSTLQGELHLHGVLESAEEVVVNVEFPAPVLRVLAEEGHQVASGQPLLELDTGKLALQLRQTEHLLEQAQTNLDGTRLRLARLEALALGGVISDQHLDDARLAHESAVARVKELESRRQLVARDLEHRIVKSPTDAIVGARHVEAGQSIMAYEPLMTLHAVRSMTISVFVGEAHLPYLSVGNAAQITTVVGTTDSTVHSISAAADPRTGNYEIKLLLENPDATLKPGMTGRVALQANTLTGQLLVPESALFSWKGRHAVYLAEGGSAIRRFVNVSINFDAQLIVEDGLVAGEELIIRGADRVTDGSAIRRTGRGTP